MICFCTCGPALEDGQPPAPAKGEAAADAKSQVIIEVGDRASLQVQPPEEELPAKYFT